MTTVSVHIPDVRLTEIRDATTTDQQMVTLAWYIKNGWPEDRRNVPEEIREYFDMGDTLGIEEGVLMKGERMIIPHKLRADMKERLHSAHLGYESMMRRARDTIYWPGMAREVKQTADNCTSCQENKPANSKETLIQHDNAVTPWEKIGCDLFLIGGRNYLVVVDYFLSFFDMTYQP